MGTFSAFSGSVASMHYDVAHHYSFYRRNTQINSFSLKEAGLALGLPYHRVILKVIVPCGVSGILSGVILSVARIAGETAPFLFTAFGNPYLSANITRPMQSLPLLIFNYATSPYEDWHNLAWGASLILLALGFTIKYFHKAVNKKMERTIIKSQDFNAYFGDNHAVKNVTYGNSAKYYCGSDGPFGLRKNNFFALH